MGARKFSSIRRISNGRPDLVRDYCRAYRLKTSAGRRRIGQQQVNLQKLADRWFRVYQAQSEMTTAGHCCPEVSLVGMDAYRDD